MCLVCTCFLLIFLTIAAVSIYFLFINKSKVDPTEDEDAVKYFWNSGGNGTSESLHPFQDHLSQSLIVNGTCYKLFRQNVCRIFSHCLPKVYQLNSNT